MFLSATPRGALRVPGKQNSASLEASHLTLKETVARDHGNAETANYLDQKVKI